MHGPDQHFLAGTAFAFDQDRIVTACGLGGDGQCLAEVGRGPDHRFEIGVGGHLLGERRELVPRCFAGRRGAQGMHQPVGSDRFHEIIGGAGAHGLHGQQR